MYQKNRFKFIISFVIVFVLTVVLIFGLSKNDGEVFAASSNTIYVGATTTVSLSASSSDTVSWQASPSGVVSFSNSTKSGGTFSVSVTGVNLGYANIVATITHSDNTTTTQNVGTIYVVLQDGIYTIENQYVKTYISSSFYLRNQIRVDSTDEIQYSSNSYGDMTNNIHRYWKIDYIENGEYAIYNLANDGKAISISGSSVVLSDVGSTVPTSARWFIRGNSIISKNNPNLGIVVALSGIQNGTYNNSTYNYFTVSAISLQSMDVEKWIFNKQENMHGIFFRNNITGEVVETFDAKVSYYDSSTTIEDLGYSCVTYTSSTLPKEEYWKSNKTHLVSIATNGSMTLSGGGEVTITKEFAIPQLDIHLNQSFNLSVLNDFGIKNNTEYYIINDGSKRYISLESISDSNGVNVSTRTRNSALYSQWKVEKQSELQYQLVNQYGSASRVMNVAYTNITIHSDSNSVQQKFNIVRIDSGSYEGRYYIKYGEYYVTEASNYNVCLTSTPTKNSVWSFSKVVKGSTNIFDFEYTYTTNNGASDTYDATTKGKLFVSSMNYLGFYEAYENTNSTPTVAKSSLMNSDVFAFRGHANGGVLLFFSQTSNNVPIGVIANTQVDLFGLTYASSTPDRQYLSTLSNSSFASSRCVLLLACRTGTTGLSGRNLVDTIYEKGAHFVLGTSYYMRTDSDDLFLEKFLEQLRAGRSIEQALTRVNNGNNDFFYKTSDDGPEIKTQQFPLYIRGDQSQVLIAN